jgi:hypothetical protein
MSSFALPSPNVYEIHSCAIYISIPISSSLASSLTASPCTPSSYNNECYLSIVVDDLDTLKSYVYGSTFMPTNMGGWMTKMNLLVKSCVPTSKEKVVEGYQILSLDFEKGVKGWVKRLGAAMTQKINSYCGVSYESSFGKSGRTRGADMVDGGRVTMNVKDGGNVQLINLTGKLRTPSPAEVEFIDFVVSRPHKFLHQGAPKDQKRQSRVVWSPWGDGWTSSTAGVKMLDTTDLDVSGILKRELTNEVYERCFPAGVREVKVCIQPEYVLIDLHNTVIS